MERELAGKTAGMRTYALVALGSTMFSLISTDAFTSYLGVSGFDPSRIAAQIVVGIGFIGGGVIIFNRSHVQGVTTAAGLWVSAAIGMAVAYEFYSMALIATVLTLLVFVVLWHFEKLIIKNFSFKKDFKKDDD